MLSPPTVAQLVAFTGRPESSFGGFATQALTQATLLFSILTQLSDYPDDTDRAALAVNAMLEMADRIYLEQPHTSVKASPYASETIGSYSYSKGSTAGKALGGMPVGLLWWDLALDELSQAQRSLVTSGSVSGLDRDVYVDTDGDRFVLGPAEIDTDWFGGDVNAETYPRTRSAVD